MKVICTHTGKWKAADGTFGDGPEFGDNCVVVKEYSHHWMKGATGYEIEGYPSDNIYNKIFFISPEEEKQEEEDKVQVAVLT